MIERCDDLMRQPVRHLHREQEKQHHDAEDRRQDAEEDADDVRGFQAKTDHITTACGEHRCIVGISPEGLRSTHRLPRALRHGFLDFRTVEMRVHGLGIALRVIEHLTVTDVHEGDAQLHILRALDILQVVIQEILHLIAALFCDFIDAGAKRIRLQHQVRIGPLIVKLKIQHLTCERTENQCKQGRDT